MRIWMLSVVFVERKAVDFKDKNVGCERKIIRKKPPSLARLSGNSAAFLPAKQLAYRARKQPQMRRSAVELRRSHSFIPPEAASIPVKNRLGSSKNSLKKQSRNSQKRVQFSSKPTIFFVRVSLQLISKNRGLPCQNRRIICDFSLKKAANTPPETLEKFENAHLIYINFICQ